MANYQNLKAAISAAIRTNGNQEITGQVLQDVLNSIVSVIGANYTFAGVATPATNPGTPDQNVMYLAMEGGTYTNFNGTVLPAGISLLMWNGSWTSETVMYGDGGVFDISVYKSTGGTLAKFADLGAALGTNGANIPAAARKGGMSVKFVQSSDNKYVQYTLTKNSFSTVVGDWIDNNLLNVLLIQDDSLFTHTGYIKSNNGTFNLDENWLCTDYIPLSNIYSIIFRCQNEQNIAGIAVYNASKEYISGLPDKKYIQSINCKDASYVRFSKLNLQPYDSTFEFYMSSKPLDIHSLEQAIAEIDLRVSDIENEIGTDGTIDVYDGEVSSEYAYIKAVDGTAVGTASGSWQHTPYIQIPKNCSIIKFSSSTPSQRIVGMAIYSSQNESSYIDGQKYDGTSLQTINVNGAKYVRFSVLTGYTLKIGYDTKIYDAVKNNSERIDVVYNNSKVNDFSKLSMISLGDSITSNDVVGLGNTIANKLGCTNLGNYAKGSATCANYRDGEGRDISTIYLGADIDYTVADARNVLMNQVYRVLQSATAEGSQITWTHPVAGNQSLATSYGTGTGVITQAPKIIYIAISVNDGKIINNVDVNPVVDDCDTVFAQAYSELTKMSIASSLRWAIETLQSKFPSSVIFVASPLFTKYNVGSPAFSSSVLMLKRSIIEKVCNYCSVYFIDSQSESGFSSLMANRMGGDGVHPIGNYKKLIASYVVDIIRAKYITREL